jgi:serine/threonine protein kinase
MSDFVKKLDIIFNADNLLKNSENPIIKDGFLDYIDSGIIGNGHFGVIKEARKNEKTYALKITIYHENNINECVTLRELNHSNIMKTYGDMIYIDNDTNFRFILLKCEYYQYDLFSLLKYHSDSPPCTSSSERYYHRLKISKVKQITLDILSALDYLHNEKKLVHRDLKLDNILITDLDHPKAVLCDFGQVKCIETANVSEKIYGSPGYISPEILTQRGIIDSTKLDIYCLGIIFNWILTGHNTHDEYEKTIIEFTNYNHFKKNILHEDDKYKELNINYSYTLFQKMTDYNFLKRINVKDALVLLNKWIKFENIENIDSINYDTESLFEMKRSLSGNINDYISEQ